MKIALQTRVCSRILNRSLLPYWRQCRSVVYGRHLSHLINNLLAHKHPLPKSRIYTRHTLYMYYMYTSVYKVYYQDMFIIFTERSSALNARSIGIKNSRVESYIAWWSDANSCYMFIATATRVSAIKIRIHIRIRIYIRIRFHVRRFLFQLSKYFRNLSRNVAPNAKGLRGMERGEGPPLRGTLMRHFNCCWIIITNFECFIYCSN